MTPRQPVVSGAELIRALDVEPQHLPNTRKRRPVAERRVAPSCVVVVEPVSQGRATVRARAVGEPARPLAVHRLVQALDLAVGPGGVGPRPPVLHPAAGKQLSEPEVLHVGEVVVGEQALGDDPVGEEEVERPLGEGGDRWRPLVAVDLGGSRPTDRGKTKEGVASALTCKSERRSYTHGQHIPG